MVGSVEVGVDLYSSGTIALSKTPPALNSKAPVAMCYFARKDFACGDWKWGNMMERCPRQHRIGETCGAKLVHTEYIESRPELCKTCTEMEVKKRRLQKVCENISRWAVEKGRFAASLEKAEVERDILVEKIKELHSQRPSVAFRGDRISQGQTTIPSLASQLDSGSSYTWSSQPRGYSVSGQPTSGYGSVNNSAARGGGSTKSEMPLSRPPVPYSPYSTKR